MTSYMWKWRFHWPHPSLNILVVHFIHSIRSEKGLFHITGCWAATSNHNIITGLLPMNQNLYYQSCLTKRKHIQEAIGNKNPKVGTGPPTNYTMHEFQGQLLDRRQRTMTTRILKINHHLFPPPLIYINPFCIRRSPFSKDTYRMAAKAYRGKAHLLVYQTNPLIGSSKVPSLPVTDTRTQKSVVSAFAGRFAIGTGPSKSVF